MAQLKNTTITGTLSTSGKATLNSAGVTGIATVGGTLGVTGKTTAKGNLQVNGDFYASGSVEDSTFTVNVPATFNKAVNAKTNFGYFGQLELSNATPYIDFHFNKSTADYTSRIIESSNGILDFVGGTYGLRLNKTAGVIYPLSKEGISLGSVEFPFYILRTMNAPVVTSVIEAKTNIKPFINALDEIDKTDVFNYNLKVCLEREGEDIEHTGFIIGKDYDISELLISHDGNSIDLYNAIGVTFGGVKELYQIVKDQQEEINNLKEEISLLKDKIG